MVSSPKAKDELRGPGIDVKTVEPEGPGSAIVSTRSDLARRPRQPHRNLRAQILARALQIAASHVTRLSPRRARSSLDALAQLAPPVRGVSRQRATVGGVPGEWYRPRGWSDGVTFIHYHGGGYALCSSRTHRMMISDLARAIGARGLGVEYRLSPEHPYPAGFDDCFSAYLGVLNQGVEPRELLLSGDSAGGALALAVMQQCRQEGHPLPRGAVLMSPWPDLTLQGETISSHDAYDYLNADVLRFFAGLYLEGHDPLDPLVSPRYADLSGLPPLLIQAGGSEMFLADIIALRDRAKADGVEVTFEVWDGMVHAFQGFTLFLPEARRAFKSVARWVRELMERTPA